MGGSLPHDKLSWVIASGSTDPRLTHVQYFCELRLRVRVLATLYVLHELPVQRYLP